MKKNIFKTLSIAMIIATMMGNNAFAYYNVDWAKADSITPISNDNSNYVISGHKVNDSTGWHRIKGNYYYFNDPMNPEPMKNTTTPDGYTVDDQGRWTVYGVVQDDGYGSFYMDTDTLYAGKSMDDIWSVMLDQAVEIGKEVKSNHNTFSSTYSASGITYGKVANANDFYLDLSHNDYSTDLRITDWDEENPEWSGNTHHDYMNESIEKAIKLLVGDHIGQELFNDIRACADPYTQSKLYNCIWYYSIDVNGIEQPIEIDSQVNKITESHADGFNLSLFPLAKWNGRTTDYGKTIKVTFAENVGDSGWIEIEVVNN